MHPSLAKSSKDSEKLNDQSLFDGKIALATGSGWGIGRAIALHFASQDAQIVVDFFHNRSPAEETTAAIRKLGHQALLVKTNVGTDDGLDHLFSELEKHFAL